MKSPWLVENISAFLYYCCPECTFRSAKNEAFENHATSNHPLSLSFFKAKSDEDDDHHQVSKDFELHETSMFHCIKCSKNIPVKSFQEHKETCQTLSILEDKENEDLEESTMTDEESRPVEVANISLVSPIMISKPSLITSVSKGSPSPIIRIEPSSSSKKMRSESESQLDTTQIEIDPLAIKQEVIENVEEPKTKYGKLEPVDGFFQCPVSPCNEQCRKVETMKQHISTSHKAPQCLECCMVFSKNERLSDHMKNAHVKVTEIFKLRPWKKDRFFNCPIQNCQRRHTSESVIRIHIATYHCPKGKFICKLCLNVLDNDQALEDHMKMEHAFNKTAENSSRNSLKRKRAKEDQEESIDDETLVPDIKQEVIEDPLETPIDTENIQLELLNGFYACPLTNCSQKSKSETVMKKHISIAHTGTPVQDHDGKPDHTFWKNPSKISITEMYLKEQHSAIEPLVVNHEDQEPDEINEDQTSFQCKKCSAEMKPSQRWMTKEDMLASAGSLQCQNCALPKDPTKAFIAKMCGFCGIQFPSHKKLNQHKSDHKATEVLNSQFTCKHCLFFSDSDGEMKQHMDNHFSKWHCFLCNENVGIYKITEHYFQCHDKKVNLKCCSKTFESHFQLLNHFRSDSCSLKTEDRTYLCPFCKKQFHQLRELCLRHFLTRYHCSKCHKCYNDKKDFANHMDKH